jgi:hypothetical protein
MIDRRNSQGFRESDWQEGQLQDLQLGDCATGLSHNDARHVGRRYGLVAWLWLAQDGWLDEDVDNGTDMERR